MRGTDGQTTHIMNAGLVPLADRTTDVVAVVGERASYGVVTLRKIGRSIVGIRSNSHVAATTSPCLQGRCPEGSVRSC
jgi:hypothetical protein